MPSGAKKRKAAKKKKEKINTSSTHNNNSSSINPQGNDDPKSQDERESDGDEVGSPSLQDYHHHPFSEGNEESEKRDDMTDQSFVPESKPEVIGNSEGNENVGLVDDGIVRIEKDCSKEDANVCIEHVELKESHNRNDRSSSSSSSDEETHASEKNWDDKFRSLKLNSNSFNKGEKEVDLFSEELAKISENEKPLNETHRNAEVEAPDVDLLMPVVPMSKVVERVMEGSQAENTEVLDIVEPGSVIKEENFFPTSNEVAVDSPPVISPEENNDNDYPKIHENNIGPATNGDEDKISTPADHSSETSFHAEIIKGCKTSDDTVDKNGVDVPKSSDAWTPESITDTENAKGSETRELTEEQPLVAPGPRLAQRTSWMNCCGLFDVFTGSGR